jgi:hypothetical protein
MVKVGLGMVDLYDVERVEATNLPGGGSAFKRSPVSNQYSTLI